MTMDFCFAVYNSAQWIEGCVNALLHVEYDTKKLALYFADIASQDDSLALLQACKAEHGERFAAFELIPMDEAATPGAAYNRAARAGRADHVCFCHINTEMFPAALLELEKAIAAGGPQDAAFELRQLPYEDPKYYNPVTLETGYASGAGLVVKRAVFEEVGGFDETLFMGGEDVDLSWHMRALGYRITYVPAACIHCHAREKPSEAKQRRRMETLAANLALRYKYGTPKDIKDGEELYKLTLDQHYESVAPQKLQSLLRGVKRHKSRYRRFYRRVVKTNARGFAPTFIGFSYAFARAGEDYASEAPAGRPFFSVIVRTYQRPRLLRQTLRSLCHQTYKHFEVVVVEDGPQPVAESVVEEMRAALNIRYHAMKSQNGLCITGNKGIELARGDYLCFLDDDDYFFAEYFEVMAAAVSQSPEERIFAARGVTAYCDSDDDAAEPFVPQQMENFGKPEISCIGIFQDNLFPVQAAVFPKSLPAQYGGLDEAMIRGYDDWEMWIRFSRHVPIQFIEKGTSIFRIPAQRLVREQRALRMLSNMPELAGRIEKYTVELNARALLEINYSPKQVEKKAGRHQTREEVYRMATEIATSKTWRATRFVRVVPSALANLAQKWANSTRRFAEYVGPQDIDFETAELEDLLCYARACRKSLSWKLPRALRGKKGQEESGGDA